MANPAAPALRSLFATGLRLIDMLSPRVVAAIALATSAFALGLALAAENGGGLLPCSLCLLERWPYRIGIALGAIGLIAPSGAMRPLLALIVLVMLADAGLALVHVGVEQHFWQNPISECAAPALTSGSVMDRVLQLSSRPPQPCDRATYLIPFVPLSMAAMNALYAGGVAALLSVFLVRTR